MKSYNTNLAFVDLLFNLLIGFTSLLLIAFLLINPIAQKAKIDPKTKILITIEWPAASAADIDLWIRGPVGNKVGFKEKDGQYIILERDDLGVGNDTYTVNGESVVIPRNMETTSINDLPVGEYVINIHNYSIGPKKGHFENHYPIPVTINVHKMDPFQIIYSTTITLSYREEKTVVSFVVDNKEKVTDLRTDTYIPLYYSKDDKKGPP